MRQGNEGVSTNVGVTVKNQATVDMVAPSVTISKPADGSKVTGTVAVSVSATDDVSVAKLQLYIDGKLVSAASGATLSYNWNTRKAKYGAHKHRGAGYGRHRQEHQEGRNGLQIVSVIHARQRRHMPALFFVAPERRSAQRLPALRSYVTSPGETARNSAASFFSGKSFGPLTTGSRMSSAPPLSPAACLIRAAW